MPAGHEKNTAGTDLSSRAGFVGLIGPPNVGKSTLLNLILGQKIAITSEKPQTTRHRILGVWSSPRAQVVFLDTPGLHQAKSLLARELVAQALAVLADVDLILLLIESFDLEVVRPGGSRQALDRPGRRAEGTELALETVKNSGRPVVLAINKIDRIKKPDLLPLMDDLRRRIPEAVLVPISARTGANVPALLEEIVKRLPEGPPFYPPETLTDQPERFIAAEMVREQVFRLTGAEIPYSTAVTVEEYKEGPALTRISAVIHVERESQKKIVIGAKGAKLKQIGSAARIEIERLTGTKVFLELFVRVQKNWTRDPAAIKRFGYTP
ncbi:MAG: GTPase Era [Thermodesulfobacteriota bacterium]